MILKLTEKFKKATGYDINKFFEDYITFTNDNYQDIINYYNGHDINQESFEILEYLQNETYKIEPLIDHYSENFDTVDFWDLNNNFSDIQSKLETCHNMGKWQRSSRLDRFSSNLKVVHIQKQNETIEKISKDAGFNDPNYWAELALANQITEEDYTNTGGKLLNISLPNNDNFNLETIVDYLIGNNIYGKDIIKKIEILSDGDLSTIEGKESLQQTFGTLMATIKNSIPEFPNDGIPPDIFGTNENIIQYPIIFRSLLSMIQKDGRFKSLELLDIKKDEDLIFIELQSTTITGDTFVNNLII